MALIFFSAIELRKNEVKFKNFCHHWISNQWPPTLAWKPQRWFFDNAVRFLTRSYQPILLIFNSKHWKAPNFLVYNFKGHQSKISTVRVPHLKTYKTAAITSSKQHFQNQRKASSQIFAVIMWSKLHQNWPNSVQIKGCHRQIHTQKDRLTHRQGSFRTKTFSHLKWL